MKIKTILNTYSIVIFISIGFLFTSCAGNSINSKDNETDRALNPNETYNINLAGVKIILDYDPADNSFKGYIENTTQNIINRVRVGIHLSNDVELGPTLAANLMPGERKDIRLSAKNFVFDCWIVHPKIGDDESQ